MARVSVVYNTLKDLVNKDQKGFITPSVFNSLAGVAQLNIYNRLFDDFKDGHRNARANFNPGRDKSLFKRLREDLAYFSKRTSLTINDAGTFNKPQDLSRVISIRTEENIDDLGEITHTQVEIVYDDEKIDRILRSPVSAPSESFPIALIGRTIQVYPSTISDIELRYYKVPQATNVATGNPVATDPAIALLPATSIIDPANSYDFELPNHYESELVIEIGQMIGVNLRDQVVQAFSATERQNNNIQQSFS